MSRVRRRVYIETRVSAIDGMDIDIYRVEVKCDCGRTLVCHDFTNTCECGCDYNMSGSQLAPREQWGCETGESVADILGHALRWAEKHGRVRRTAPESRKNQPIGVK